MGKIHHQTCSLSLIWLNFYGVPLHLWSAVNFIKLGKIWGEVVNVADETSKCLSFAVGKVLVSTSAMDPVNEVMDIECRNEVFKIRVVEEQLVIHTFLKTICTCKGCNIQEAVALLQDNVDSSDDGSKVDESKNEVELKQDGGWMVKFGNSFGFCGKSSEFCGSNC